MNISFTALIDPSDRRRAYVISCGTRHSFINYGDQYAAAIRYMSWITNGAVEYIGDPTPVESDKGRTVRLTSRKEIDEAAKRVMSQLPAGMVYYNLPEVGDLGKIVRTSLDGIFEVRFEHVTILCNMVMVEFVTLCKNCGREIIIERVLNGPLIRGGHYTVWAHRDTRYAPCDQLTDGIDRWQPDMKGRTYAEPVLNKE